MTKEHYDMLVEDICARLPYAPKIRVSYPFLEEKDLYPETLCSIDMERQTVNNTDIPLDDVKLYLRPISSMTEQEALELRDIFTSGGNDRDFLNAHYLDYRGLIRRGLALEAPADMYEF